MYSSYPTVFFPKRTWRSLWFIRRASAGMDGLSLGVSSLLALVDSVVVDIVVHDAAVISVGVMIFLYGGGGGSGRRCRLRWWCVSLDPCRRCRTTLPPP